MANFDIKLTKESEAKIKSLAKAGKIDLRPTLKVIGIGYRKEVAQIFDKKQPRGEGLSWPALSPKYAERKERLFAGKPMLVRTGSLIRSMTIEGADGNITAISKTSAIFGSSIPYGIYHDSDQPRSRLPRRNFSEPSDRRRDIWVKQISDQLIQNFAENGISVEGPVAK